MINLETIPLSEVPKGGVVIANLPHGYLVLVKTHGVSEYDDRCVIKILYSTYAGDNLKGGEAVIGGDVQVAYTGIIFKGRRG